MGVQAGDQAPDFELINDAREKVRLSDYRGKKNVLLVFYPTAFSRTCTAEFCEMRDTNTDLVSDENLEVIGVSTDTFFTLAAWKQAEAYKNMFVSDFWPHGEVSRAYGTFNDFTGTAMRSTFLIDKEGVIRFAEVGSLETVGSARDQNAWRDALATLS